MLQKITLKWHGDLPPGNIEDIELVVLQDISESLGSLETPSDLIFHFVPLGDSYDGPSVIVWGETNDNLHFHCEYSSETQWVSENEDKHHG